MRRESPPATRGRASLWASLIIGLEMWLWISSPSVWRLYRTIRWYVGTQFISTIGSWLQFSAISVLTYQLTGQAASLALSMLAGLLPGSIISPLAGKLADRHPTRTIMLVSYGGLVIQAVTLGILQYTGSLQAVWVLYALQVVASCLNGLNKPAESKLIPQLVKREHRRDGLVINSVALNLAWIAGSPLAGVIIGAWGAAGVTWLFIGNAISYIGVVVYLFRLQVGRDVPLPETDDEGAVPAHNRGTLRETLRFIFGTPKLWLLLLVGTVMALCCTCGGVLQPLIGLKLGGIRGYTLISMSNGIGCLIGSIWLLRLKGQTLRSQIIVAIVTSAFLTGFGLSPDLLLAMVTMAAGAVTAQMLLTGTDTLLQSYVPLHLLGRVNGIYQSIRTGGIVISSLCAGYLMVPTIGASATGAALSATGLVGFMAIEAIFQLLRRAGKLEKAFNAQYAAITFHLH